MIHFRVQLELVQQLPNGLQIEGLLLRSIRNAETTTQVECMQVRELHYRLLPHLSQAFVSHTLGASE